MIVVELYNDVFDVEVSASSLDVSVSQEAQVLDATVLKDTDALLQEKIVSITKNGETVITPDDGFDGMKAVKVDANIDPLSQCGYAEFDFVTDRGNNSSIWQRIKRINASCFDTSKLTGMGNMFYACSSLTTLDVSNFNTSNVTNMGRMFNACSSLTTLDVSNFDTSNVTNMYQMFLTCSSLTTLDVSNFNTSNVTNMGRMFNACSSLTTLDVSNFDTSNVTNMYQMFWTCSSLTTLDVSNFDTSKVTNMGSMFYACSSLTTLDVSNFNTSNVTDMTGVFWSCSSLTTLDVSNFDTSKVTNMGSIFVYCRRLKSIIGEKSLEDVENGIVALKGTKVNLSIGSPSKLRYSSMLAVTKGLADLTGQKAQTISFNRAAWNNMFNDDDTIPTSDVIAERKATLSAIAASKNWNLSY